MTDTDPNTIALDYPIARGEQQIAEVTLRKPNAGSLRGLSIAAVLQLDIDALVRLIPRISDPALTEAEVRALDPADLTQLATGTASFFVARRYREEAQATT